MPHLTISDDISRRIQMEEGWIKFEPTPLAPRCSGVEYEMVRRMPREWLKGHGDDVRRIIHMAIEKISIKNNQIRVNLTLMAREIVALGRKAEKVALTRAKPVRVKQERQECAYRDLRPDEQAERKA